MKRRPGAIATGLIVLACGLALWVRYQFVMLYGGAGDYLAWADQQYFGGISRFYVASASDLAAGRPYLNMGYPPGYPLLLSVFVRAGMAMPGEMRWLQIVCDSLAVAAVFGLARACGLSRASSVAAGWAYALWPLWASGATFLLAESLTPALCVAALLATVAASRRGAPTWLVAGVATGGAVLVRPDLVPLAAALVTFLAATVVRRLLYFSVFTIGVLAVLAPWGIHNRLAHGAWVFTSSSAGVALYEGLGDLPNPYGYVTDDSVANHLLIAHGIHGGAGTPEGNRFLIGEYVRAAVAHPAHVLRAVGYRWGAILFSSEHLQPLYFARLRQLADLAGPLALIAGLLLTRDKPALLLAQAAPLLCALLSIGLTHYEPRYVRYAQLSYLFGALVVLEALRRSLRAAAPRLVVPVGAIGAVGLTVYSLKQLVDLHHAAIGAMRF